MGASERRGMRRRIIAGCVGVGVVNVLFAVTAFAEYGLSWRAMGVIAVIGALSIVLTPVFTATTEAFRRAMRRREE